MFLKHKIAEATLVQYTKCPNLCEKAEANGAESITMKNDNTVFNL